MSEEIKGEDEEIFLFFFQAEDGIRDIGVTGVQTCALPILTAAATLAFSDSTSVAIGMLTRMSHVSPTSRDSPRPSEPTTTSSGPTAASNWYRSVSPSASRPMAVKPACWHALIARVRLTTWDTGTRAAAPALVRQAVAVMPAARRSVMKTP